MLRQCFVPPISRPILQQIVFILPFRVVDDVSISALSKSFQRLNVNLLRLQLLRFEPSHERFLVGIVSCRHCSDARTLISVAQTGWSTVVTACRHEVIFARSDILSTSCIIEIRQSQTVRKLMTDGPDTHVEDSISTVIVGTKNLIAACIGVDLDTINGHWRFSGVT